MKKFILAVCLLVAAAGGQARTWTFRRDGQIQAQGGATSFRKGGTLNAVLVRVDGTNVILRLALNGKDGVIPVDCLSDADRAYLGVNTKSVPAASQQAKFSDVPSYLKTNAGNQMSVPAASQQAKSNDVASYLKTNTGNQVSVPPVSQQAKSNDVASYLKTNAGNQVSVPAASQQTKSNDVASSLKTNAGNQMSVPAASQQAKSNDVASFLKTNAGNQLSVPAASQQAKSNDVASYVKTNAGNGMSVPAASQQVKSNDVASYLKANTGDLVNGISQDDFPKTEKGAAACKEIVSELKQLQGVLDAVTYERLGSLLQGKTLAIQKTEDLHEEDIPGAFMRHADLCLKRLNRSRRYWRDEIRADDKDSKAFYGYMKRADWEESVIDMLYCVAIAEKDPGVMPKIYEQKALIIQHEQAAIKAGLLSDSGLPLLPPMTQQEIISWLSWTVEGMRASSK